MWETVGARVEALLAESARWTGGKQRLTATRLHELLVAEGHAVGVTLVKEAVAEWRRQRREVFVPLAYRPGDLAEVDFFEVLVDVGGHAPQGVDVRDAADVFGPRLRWIYPRQDQVSFLDGHVRAFAHFGAVPPRVAYDNLRAAVVRDSGRRRAHADGALRSAGVALSARAELLPARRGPRQRRGRGARQGDSPAGARADSDRRRRSATINAALLARWTRGRDVRDAVGQTIGIRFAEEQRLCDGRPGRLRPEATTLATVTPARAGAPGGRIVFRAARWPVSISSCVSARRR